MSSFIGEYGTIRVKGRLKHPNLDYNEKYPILLTAKHPAVQLLLKKAHQDNLHEGTEYVRNILQQVYWIIGLRNALTKLRRDVSNADRGTPTQSTHRWKTYPENDLMNLCSHSPILESNTSEPLKWSSYDVSWSDGAAPSLVWQPEQCTSKSQVIGQRVVSSCSDKIHRKTWLPKYHHQWQRNTFRFS